MRIATKIWLSVGIVIGGYILATALTFWMAIQTQANLRKTESSTYPVARFCEKALTAYRTRLRGFQDAVVAGDQAQLKKAQDESRLAVEALEAAGAIPGLEPSQVKGFRDAASRLRELDLEAAKVYPSLSQGQANEALLERVTALGRDSTEFQKVLEKFAAAGETTVHAEIASMVRRTQMQVIFSLAFCVGIVVVSTLAMRSVINRSTRPLMDMTETAKRLGNGDVEQRIDHFAKDETGMLADAFREMIRYVADAAHATRALSNGDLSAAVNVRSHSDTLTRSVGEAQRVLGAVVGEMKRVITSARAGELDVRGDDASFRGVYAELLVGLNQALEAVVLPLDEIVRVVVQLADHDLTARMSGSYAGDFKRAETSLNSALDRLDDVLGQVKVAAEQVASASQEISSGSQWMAQAASEQAASVAEISTSLTQLTSTAAQNSAEARKARDLGDRAGKSAERGCGNMQRLTQAIGKIKSAADQTARIVKTIQEIAFQTNLLALNAAVEAARAGDSGRGFAVVAEEVRNLAIRAAAAANQTTALIEESVKSTHEGVKLNNEVQVDLEEINRSVSQVGESIRSIAVASEQQAHGAAEIQKALESISDLTRRTAAHAEESAAAGEELTAQATTMKTLVDRFNLSDSPQGGFHDPKRLLVQV